MHPISANQTRRTCSGFTLVEIMIVVMILGLLTAIAMPSFQKARKTAQKNSCLDNLRMIDSALQQYMLEFKQTELGAGYRDHMGDYIQHLDRMTCPSGGSYEDGDGGDVLPSCSVDTHVLPGEVEP